MRKRNLSTSDVRAHNLGLVLDCVDRLGAASRTEIAAETGLARSALTAITAELIDSGLIRSATSDEAGAHAVGRPQERLEVDGRDRVILGAQLQLDEVLLLAVDLGGRVVRQSAHAVRTPLGAPVAIADILAEHVGAMRSGLADEGVTVIELVAVMPAPVNVESGVVPVAIDFHWVDVDIVSLLGERLEPFPLGIRVMNDANSAAFAEFSSLHDADPAITDLVYLKADTGVGGGAIVSGRMLEGSNGYAFEPGHTVVVADGPPCRCGSRGCLVTVADPEIVLAEAGLAELRALAGAPEALAELVRRHRAADPAAVAAIDRALGWFRLVIRNLVMLFQPHVVVVGGYLSEFVGPLAADSATALPPIVVAGAHGRMSALDGAVLLARRAVLTAPAPVLR